MLVQELRRSSQEFLRRTRAWKAWLDPQTTADGSVEYDLDIPFGSVVVRVEKANVSGASVEVLSAGAQLGDWAHGGAAANGAETEAAADGEAAAPTSSAAAEQPKTSTGLNFDDEAT